MPAPPNLDGVNVTAGTTISVCGCEITPMMGEDGRLACLRVITPRGVEIVDRDNMWVARRE